MSAVGTAVLAIVATLLGSVVTSVLQARQAAKNRAWEVEDREAAQVATERQWYRESRERRELALRTQRVQAYEELLRSSDAVYDNALSSHMAIIRDGTSPDVQANFGTRNEALARIMGMLGSYRDVQALVMVVGDEAVARTTGPMSDAIGQIGQLVTSSRDPAALLIALTSMAEAKGPLVKAMREDLNARFLAPPAETAPR